VTDSKGHKNGDKPEERNGSSREEQAGRKLDRLLTGTGPADRTAEPGTRDEELKELSAAARILKASAASVAPKLPDREGLLDDVFATMEGRVEAPADGSPDPSPATEEHEAQAEALGRLMDQMLSGQAPPPQADLDRPLADLLQVCHMLHAAMHGSVLGASRRQSALDNALDTFEQEPARVEAGPEPASARPAATGWWIGAAALAAGIAAVAITWNVVRTPPRTPTGPTRAEMLSQRAQRLRVLLPGPFPRHQTASHRIEVIYSDRMRAYRWNMIRSAGRTGRSRLARLARTDPGRLSYGTNRTRKGPFPDNAIAVTWANACCPGGHR
jgi:hypothetical protein